MSDGKNFVGRVAVIEQEGLVIRVLLNEGETMYAARDILAACGVKYPTKWCQREAQANSPVKLIKLDYPVNGKTGGTSRRSVPMYFVSEKCGRMILDMVGCDKGVRSWLESEVFSYKLKPAEDHEPVIVTEPAKKVEPAMDVDEFLSRRIDNLLFELLEIKKYIAQPRT